MSQIERLGGANQLNQKAFGQFQIIFILEPSNTLVPKSLSPTFIFWYPLVYNRLPVHFCFLWKNTFVDCIIETKEFLR